MFGTRWKVAKFDQIVLLLIYPSSSLKMPCVLTIYYFSNYFLSKVYNGDTWLRVTE